MPIWVAAFRDLDAATLYALLRLRVDVFVVEQACPYPELDGRDLEPGARHWWLTDEADQPTAYLRTLVEGDGTTRVGRVATRRDQRGSGQARRLVEAVIEEVDGTLVADAQAHLVGWYRDLGFTVTGGEFVEDGIRHVPLRRDPPASPG